MTRSDLAPAGFRLAADPIAVVGIACRLPGAETAAQFWRLLADGVDAITETPPDRWPGRAGAGLRWGGFLHGLDEFDAPFFRFSPREADGCDPQQRIMLQLAWHALEDARLPPLSVRGSECGVFIGAMSDEYARLALAGDPAELAGHSLTGVQRGIIANRISHFLDARGPSLVVDTAQSSGLAAVHLAAESLRTGTSRLALAGAVNLNLLTSTANATDRFGALSERGRCATFDAEADGYVRGEGAGMVVLMPLAEALAAGLDPYCVLLGSAMNSDGQTATLTTPDGPAQTRVIGQAWRNAGVSPRDLQYVELHGTGTRLGDPAEARALGAALAGRTGAPLPVGSAKTNVGHCEGAAGIVGLIKAALSIRHRRLPASLHFRTPSSPLDELGLRVVTELSEWPRPGDRLIAGVSSFGMGGTNCHLVLAEPAVLSEPAGRPGVSIADPGGLPHAKPGGLSPQWWLTGTDRPALARQASALLAHLADRPDATAAEVGYSLASTRSPLRHRAALLGSDRDGLLAALAALAGGAAHPDLLLDRARSGRLAMLFPGQGSQLVGAGAELCRAEPSFGDAVRELLEQWPSEGLRQAMFDRDAQHRYPLADTAYAQPALFVLQVASYRLLARWGVRPEVLIGHSIGELAAAQVAGVFSLAEASRLVEARARLMQAMPAGGAMIALEATEDEVNRLLADFADRLALAAVNAPRSVVISGERAAARQLAERLAGQGRRTRELRVSHAFHSPQMAGMREEFARVAAGIDYRQPELAVLPTGRSGARPADWASAEYWVEQVRQPVRFADAVAAAAARGIDTFLEAAPGRTLAGLVRQCLPDDEPVTVSLLPSATDEPAHAARAAGRLFCAGIPVDWAAYAGTSRTIELPGYQFAPDRHWLRSAEPADSAEPVAAEPADSAEPVAAEPVAAAAAAPPSRLDRSDPNEPVRSALARPDAAELVCSALASTLGHPSAAGLDLELPFTDLGLDSGLTVELLDRLNQHLDQPLTVGTLFSAVTPRELIGRLGGAGSDAGPAERPAATGEPIAIIGIGCRYPGGITDAESLWQLVCQERHAVGPFPSDRGWPELAASYPKVGGFLPDAAEFDAEFFNISPREALAMDPQQRLQLEISWHALEDAGLSPAELRGSDTGVFVGLTAGDYGPRMAEADRTAGYTLTGSTPSVASGRIAYYLDLRGPALTVDTACSSSLVAVHLAMQALRAGQCGLALAGGAAVMSTPGMFAEFDRQHGLSAAGRCASFAAGADGTVWSEGVGMLVLQPLSAARAAGHRVLGVLLGSAVNSDGASNGLTAPNGRAQRAVIRAALRDAGLAPDRVDAIEAHGTGTALGDPIEADGILDTYGDRPAGAEPVLLGSLKSNLGHTQAAAGVGSVIKLVEAMRHGWLPRTLHVDAPTTEVDWQRGRVELLTSGRAWPETGRPRTAAVSSFGISGTNAHVLLQQGDPAPKSSEPVSAGDHVADAGDEPTVWLIAARTEQAVAEQAAALAARLAERPEPPAAVAAALTRTRSGLASRAAVAGDAEALLAGLHRIATGQPAETASGRRAEPGASQQARLVTGQALPAGSRRAFLLSGQGAQRAGMGRLLATRFGVFGRTLSEVCQHFDDELGEPLSAVLFDDSEAGRRRLEQTRFAQPALFAYQLAAASLLAAFGIEPDVLLGHSIGELVAAQLAGVLELPDACRLVAARGRLMQQARPGGAMVAFDADADADELAGLLAGREDRISLAAVNGPRAVVLSGDADVLAELHDGWRGRGRRATALRVSHAFHSAHMAEAAEQFEQVCADVRFGEPRIPVISNETGRLAEPAQLADPAYWARLIRQPVLFAAGLDGLLDSGVRLFYELGPDRVLAGLAASALDAAGHDGLAVSLGRRDRAEDEAALGLLAEAACRDRDFAPRHPGPLPTLPAYRFQRSRYWLAPAAQATAPAAEQVDHPLVDSLITVAESGDRLVTALLSARRQPWLADHVIAGRPIASATTLLEIAATAGRLTEAGALAEFVIERPVPVTGEVALQLRVTPDGRLDLHARAGRVGNWQRCASGRFGEPATSPAVTGFGSAHPDQPAGELYPTLDGLGYRYGPAFQAVTGYRRSADQAGAEVRLSGTPAAEAGRFLLHPALLDATLHPLLLLADPAAGLRLPFAWSDVRVHRPGCEALTARWQRVRGDTWQLTGLDPAGALAVTGSVSFRPVERSRLTAGLPAAPHGVAWRPAAPAAGRVRTIGELLEAGRPPLLADARPLADFTGPLPDVVVARVGGDSPSENVPDAVLEQADAARRLLQAWLDQPGAEASRLVLLTRDAMAAGARTGLAGARTGLAGAPIGLAGAAVWGLVRAAQTEHPGRFGLLDLPPGEPDPQLLREALRLPADQLALRDGRCLQPELELLAAAEPAEQPFGTGTVLLTGGTGALGSLIARHLVHRHGVRRLVLASRTGAGAEELLAELAEAGAQVRLARCDLGEVEQVRRLVAGIDGLTAVLHAAGVLDDRTLRRLDRPALASVFRAKVDAAWHLHLATEQLPLRQFVLFSSVSGVLGSAGQANYAAANSFLDALAEHRAGLGLAARSLAWGLWQLPGGMSGELAAADVQRWARRGIAPIDAELGMALFDTAVASDRPVVVPIAAAPGAIGPLAAGSARTGSANTVAAGSANTASDESSSADSAAANRPGSDWAAGLAGRSEREQAQAVAALVSDTVAEVLGRDRSQRVASKASFAELGIDSLTGLEVRNQLAAVTGLALPASLVFDLPTPADVTGHLLRQLKPAATEKAITRRAATDEPIAVVGMACRYPGGVTDPDQLWQLVLDGRDAIGGFPTNRGWALDRLFHPDPDHPGTSYCDQGGFLYSADEFDADFFGIGPREAACLDPQQRLLLEVAWEALERGGIRVDRLHGSATGVYAGVMYHDYASRLPTPPAAAEGYLLTGNTGSVLSGRLAYTFGLQGPAITLDTACSSSLVAIHLAIRALRSGECDLALAGGVTVMSTPGTFLEFSRQRGLAPDGRCKSFGAGADGTGWSEGVGVLVLKPLAAAERDGDEILALIRGSAVNSDGASNGLTAPNGPSQERVIQQALLDAGLSTEDVDAVEAHGTGTALGDPIEARSLLNTYGAGRNGEPLWLGSLKSNIGHSQAAAGVGGVIKSIQALRHGVLPRTLHAEQPSPHIDWDDSRIRLLTEQRDWPASDRPRRMAVSSFGISGTNAHLVLEQAPAGAAQPAGDEPPASAGQPTALPFVLSAHTETALARSARRLAERVAGEPGLSLPALAGTLARRRTPLRCRTGLVAADRDGLLAGLRALPAARTASTDPMLALVCSGQGSQRPGAGAELYRSFPAFAEAFDAVAAEFAGLLGIPLAELAFRSGPELLDRTEHTQPVLFALQVAQAELLAGFGLRPQLLLGHSIGELSACYLAGLWTLPDACALVAARGRLMAAAAAGGAMLSVAAGAERVEPWLAGADSVSVAAVNAPNQLVLSGRRDELESIAERARAEDVRVRPLRVSHAFHSADMDEAADELRAVAAGVRFGELRCPVVSTLTGRLAGAELAEPTYWADQLRRTVRFADAIGAAAEHGADLFLELAPTASLSPLIAECLPALEPIPLLRKDVPERQACYQALVAAHCQGAEVDWDAVLPGTGGLALPSYPFEHRRFWLEPDPVLPTGPLLDLEVPQLDERSRVYAGRLTVAELPWLTEHRIAGRGIAPGAAVVDWLLSATRRAGCPVIEELVLHEPIPVGEAEQLQVQVAVSYPADGDQATLLVRSRAGDGPWRRHASGTARPGPAEAAEFDAGQPVESVAVDQLYRELAGHGYDYGPALQCLQTLDRTEDGWRASLRLPAAPVPGRHEISPALLDAALHPLALAAVRDGGSQAGLVVPFAWHGIRGFDHDQPPAEVLVRLRRLDESSWALRITDPAGQPMLTVDALTLRRIPADELGPAGSAGSAGPAGSAGSANLLYRPDWQPLAAPPASTDWRELTDPAADAASGCVVFCPVPQAEPQPEAGRGRRAGSPGRPADRRPAGRGDGAALPAIGAAVAGRAGGAR